MTKNQISAILTVAKNLENLAKELKLNVIEAVTIDDCDDIVDELTSDFFDPEEVMKYMEDNNYFENAKIEDGTPMLVPTVELNTNNLYFTIKTDIGTSKLIMSNGSADGESPQMSIGYLDDENNLFDLALVEIKRGDLATIDALPTDNMDIDIYMYGSACTEDYTNHARLKYADIKNCI